jgi:hypothetical protein
MDLFVGHASAASPLGMVVDDIDAKMDDITYRLAEFMATKKEEWKKMKSSNPPVDSYQEDPVIVAQASIAYHQIMITNSGTREQMDRKISTGLWCPCVIPKTVARESVFVKTMQCINAIYNYDLGYGESIEAELCNSYKYNEDHGMIMFYLRTDTPVEFIHADTSRPREYRKDDIMRPFMDHPLGDSNGNLIVNEPPGPVIRFDLMTGQVDTDNGRPVFKSALAIVQWMAYMNGLGMQIPPKDFFIIPLPSVLSKASITHDELLSEFEESDINYLDTVRSALYQLGCAQAYVTKRPFPFDFVDYIEEYDIDASTLTGAEDATRGYFREVILPLFSVDMQNLSGIKFLVWSNQFFECLIMYTRRSSSDEVNSAVQESEISGNEPRDALPNRIFDSQYRIYMYKT